MRSGAACPPPRFSTRRCSRTSALALSALYSATPCACRPIELACGWCSVSAFRSCSPPISPATRVAYELYGRDDPYARVASGAVDRRLGACQLVLIVGRRGPTAASACTSRSGVPAHYRASSPYCFAMATLLPTLAHLGFAPMAREIAVRHAAAFSTLDAGPASEPLSSVRGRLARFGGSLGRRDLAARPVAQPGTSAGAGARSRCAIPGVVQVPAGFSVLEASRLHGIPHLSLCGGRARCSTCRVRVEGPAAIACRPWTRPSALTLARIGAGAGYAARLPAEAIRRHRRHAAPGAGQARRSGVRGAGVGRRARARHPVHRPAALDHACREGICPTTWPTCWTSTSTAVGDAVREAGGVPNQFIGDSVMAIFGAGGRYRSEASRQAIAAARGIERRMAR